VGQKKKAVGEKKVGQRFRKKGIPRKKATSIERFFLSFDIGRAGGGIEGQHQCPSGESHNGI